MPVDTVYQVRSGNIKTGPWTYTVSPKKTLSDSWDLKADKLSAYDMSVYGPNGFFRAFKGGIAGATRTDLKVVPTYEPVTESISVAVTNQGTQTAEVVMKNVYTGEVVRQALLPGKSFTKLWHLKEVYGWYDLTVRVASDASFLRHLAGHVETGKDSATDPAIGGLGRAP